MNIIKYNSSKDSTNARTGANTTVINGGTPSGGNSESASKLAETHSIFGQPFDGTQDVSGDITNVQNITAVGGDVVVKTQTDSDGEYGGNIEADKNIKADCKIKVRLPTCFSSREIPPKNNPIPYIPIKDGNATI